VVPWAIIPSITHTQGGWRIFKDFTRVIVGFDPYKKPSGVLFATREWRVSIYNLYRNKRW